MPRLRAKAIVLPSADQAGGSIPSQRHLAPNVVRARHRPRRSTVARSDLERVQIRQGRRRPVGDLVSHRRPGRPARVGHERLLAASGSGLQDDPLSEPLVVGDGLVVGRPARVEQREVRGARRAAPRLRPDPRTRAGPALAGRSGNQTRAARRLPRGRQKARRARRSPPTSRALPAMRGSPPTPRDELGLGSGPSLARGRVTEKESWGPVAWLPACAAAGHIAGPAADLIDAVPLAASPTSRVRRSG